MDCKKVQKLIQGLVLDELDVETKTQASDHIETCANCRKELERSREVVMQLGKIKQIETSQQRREKVLEAMQDAYKDKIDRVIKALDRRSIYRLATVAAVFLIVFILTIGYLIYTSGRSRYALRIAGIDGKVLLGKPALDEYKGISSGEVIKDGRILTSATSVLSAEILNLDSLRKEGEIYVNQNTSLTIKPRGKNIVILMESGEIFMELNDSALAQIDIMTPSGDKFHISKASQFEAGLRDTISLKASIPDESMRSEAKDISFEGVPLAQVIQKLSDILGVRLEPASDIVGEKRIYFYGDSRDTHLFDRFEQAMQKQGIVLVPQQEGLYRVNIAESAERQFLKRMFVRVTKGAGILSAERGTIELVQGKEGFIDPDGYPNLLKLASYNIASWRKHGYYSFIARISPVIMRLLGESKDGMPVFELRVEGTEFFANVMGQNLRITVSEQTIGNIPYSDKEITVPVKVKVLPVKR